MQSLIKFFSDISDLLFSQWMWTKCKGPRLTGSAEKLQRAKLTWSLSPLILSDCFSPFLWGRYTLISYPAAITIRALRDSGTRKPFLSIFPCCSTPVRISLTHLYISISYSSVCGSVITFLCFWQTPSRCPTHAHRQTHSHHLLLQTDPTFPGTVIDECGRGCF